MPIKKNIHSNKKIVHDTKLKQQNSLKKLKVPIQQNNSFANILYAGNLTKFGKSLSYSIHESDVYISLILILDDTNQKWVVHIPISQNLAELFHLWKTKPKFANHKLLANWVLSSTNLEFVEEIIVGARYDQIKFEEKCIQELRRCAHLPIENQQLHNYKSKPSLDQLSDSTSADLLNDMINPSPFDSKPAANIQESDVDVDDNDHEDDDNSTSSLSESSKKSQTKLRKKIKKKKKKKKKTQTKSNQKLKFSSSSPTPSSNSTIATTTTNTNHHQTTTAASTSTSNYYSDSKTQQQQQQQHHHRHHHHESSAVNEENQVTKSDLLNELLSVKGTVGNALANFDSELALLKGNIELNQKVKNDEQEIYFSVAEPNQELISNYESEITALKGQMKDMLQQLKEVQKQLVEQNNKERKLLKEQESQNHFTSTPSSPVKKLNYQNEGQLTPLPSTTTRERMSERSVNTPTSQFQQLQLSPLPLHLPSNSSSLTSPSPSTFSPAPAPAPVPTPLSLQAIESNPSLTSLHSPFSQKLLNDSNTEPFDHLSPDTLLNRVQMNPSDENKAIRHLATLDRWKILKRGLLNLIRETKTTKNQNIPYKSERFHIITLLPLVEKTTDPLLLKEAINLFIKWKHTTLAVLTLKRIVTLFDQLPSSSSSSPASTILDEIFPNYSIFSNILTTFFEFLNIHSLCLNILLLILMKSKSLSKYQDVGTEVTSSLLSLLSRDYSSDYSLSSQRSLLLSNLDLCSILTEFSSLNRYRYGTKDSCHLMSQLFLKYSLQYEIIRKLIKCLYFITKDSSMILTRYGECGLCEILINGLNQSLLQQSLHELYARGILILCTSRHRLNQSKLGTITNFHIILTCIEKWYDSSAIPPAATTFSKLAYMLEGILSGNEVVVQVASTIPHFFYCFYKIIQNYENIYLENVITTCKFIATIHHYTPLRSQLIEFCFFLDKVLNGEEKDKKGEGEKREGEDQDKEGGISAKGYLRKLYNKLLYLLEKKEKQGKSENEKNEKNEINEEKRIKIERNEKKEKEKRKKSEGREGREGSEGAEDDEMKKKSIELKSKEVPDNERRTNRSMSLRKKTSIGEKNENKKENKKEKKKENENQSNEEENMPSVSTPLPTTPTPPSSQRKSNGNKVNSHRKLLIQSVETETETENETINTSSTNTPMPMNLTTEEMTAIHASDDLHKKEISHENAIQLIQKAFRNYKIRQHSKTKSFRVATLLQIISTSNNSEIILEAMKTSVETHHEPLGILALQRINELIKYAKDSKTTLPIIVILVHKPTHLLELLQIWQTNDLYLECGYQILTRLSYANGACDTLGKDVTFQFLFQTLTRIYKNETLCSDCLGCVVRLISKCSKNRLRCGHMSYFSVISDILIYYGTLPTTPSRTIYDRATKFLTYTLENSPTNQNNYRDSGGFDVITRLLSDSLFFLPLHRNHSINSSNSQESSSSVSSSKKSTPVTFLEMICRIIFYSCALNNQINLRILRNHVNLNNYLKIYLHFLQQPISIEGMKSILTLLTGLYSPSSSSSSSASVSASSHEEKPEYESGRKENYKDTGNGNGNGNDDLHEVFTQVPLLSYLEQYVSLVKIPSNNSTTSSSKGNDKDKDRDRDKDRDKDKEKEDMVFMTLSLIQLFISNPSFHLSLSSSSSSSSSLSSQLSIFLRSLNQFRNKKYSKKIRKYAKSITVKDTQGGEKSEGEKDEEGEDEDTL